MTDEIHHYCSPFVFLSLIKNKELWLTSLTQSNDHLEGTWLLRHWLECFDHRVPKERLRKKGAQLAVEGVIRQNVILGMCFSEDRDLLSQWRGYAQDGAGFSVTFSREKLLKMANNLDYSSPLTLSKISYGNQDRPEINDAAQTLYDAFTSDADLYDEGQDGVGGMSLRFTPEKRLMQKDAVRKLFTVKNGAFKEEREWRFLLFDSINEIPNVEFKENRHVISPFVRLNLLEDALLGVTLGPTNRTPISMVEAALKTYGIEGWVRRSNASYRN